MVMINLFCFCRFSCAGSLVISLSLSYSVLSRYNIVILLQHFEFVICPVVHYEDKCELIIINLCMVIHTAVKSAFPKTARNNKMSCLAATGHNMFTYLFAILPNVS